METTHAAETPMAKGSTELLDRFQRVRRVSETICAPLEIEDYLVQTMEQASPTKWHLAHTTWFLETFLLIPYGAGYEPFHPQFGYLFNSYYNSVGEMHKRPLRGLLSRPTVAEIMDYRHHVDAAMTRLLLKQDPVPPKLAELLVTGIHHEQQHQELMLTDIKTVFGENPLRPAYRSDLRPRPAGPADALRWISNEGGLVNLGRDHDPGVFTFDNETPRHRVHLEPFELAHRLVTNGEFLEFMKDGGYETSALWLSDGWAEVQKNEWKAPRYWERIGDDWTALTLGGMESVRSGEPVCHVSFYEADAFARWAGARLPLEAEWEHLATSIPSEANLLDLDHLHPARPTDPGPVEQLYGDVWEWTGSPYSPYPGYQPAAGALGEYNGKFMVNQMVLRGGSCVTSREHLRSTYRNFWGPWTRFQFTGLRLARHRMNRG